MTNSSLCAIGWNAFFEDQLAQSHEQPVIIVRVSAHHGTQVVLYGETGEFRVPVQSALAAGTIAIGDWLVLNAADNRAVQRLERKTLLTRKAAGEEAKSQALVANVDTVFIVTSCNDDFNRSRIERYLAMALQAGVTPVLVLTKADLCDDPAALVRQARQLHPELAVEFMDARCPEQAAILRSWCGPGESVALLGSSGVGKSTLANALGADDLATGDIRHQDGKGRHTTTSRSLHLLPTGGVLVDNPGVREFQLPDCDDGVTDVFEDVVSLIAECKFTNCGHDSEPGCAIRAAIKSGELGERRYANFQKLNEEQARNAKILAKRREREAARTNKAAIARRRRLRKES